MGSLQCGGRVSQSCRPEQGGDDDDDDHDDDSDGDDGCCFGEGIVTKGKKHSVTFGNYSTDDQL